LAGGGSGGLLDDWLPGHQQYVTERKTFPKTGAEARGEGGGDEGRRAAGGAAPSAGAPAGLQRAAASAPGGPAARRWKQALQELGGAEQLLKERRGRHRCDAAASSSLQFEALQPEQYVTECILTKNSYVLLVI
jgi:hypothetical protein